jgi:hypothetical protein
VPGDIVTVAITLGALTPDLVDKPLAWYLQVLPNGRTFAHSLLVGVTLVVLLRALGREQRAVTGAFSFGYLAHILGDALQPVLTGNFQDLHFLAWPLTTPPESYDGVADVVSHQQLTPFFGLEIIMTFAGLALWWFHGRPGLVVVRRWVRRADPTAA